MAASDQNYRNQYTLDIVFAVTSILMLVSLIGMFLQDYNREYKEEQRRFRDVESAIAQRQALEQIPSADDLKKLEDVVETARTKRQADDETVRSLRSEIAAVLPAKEKAEAAFQAINAVLASRASFYNIEVDNNGPETDLAKRLKTEVIDLARRLDEAKKKKDGFLAQIQERQRKVDELDAPLTVAESNLKKANDKFDAQVKLSIAKQWGFGDWVRNLPVLDGFASPTKIHQFTIDDIPINYNFKYVTRFDRCMTCHQGIDRPAYTKKNLEDLKSVSKEQEKKLAEARDILQQRLTVLKGLDSARGVANPLDLKITTISDSYLTDARINEYKAHPRLDLFVGSNSKHPTEKFGCTSCHSGQGSATTFTLAAHTPNTTATKERWIGQHQWAVTHKQHGGAEPSQLWDFPMHPMRFVESSCIKCHHEVTDLISSDNRLEAPKLLRGFKLINDNGCFGCHEIHGRKAGRQVGPDLRLESSPPLEDLTPAQRTKVEADPDTSPGNLRKVGPSLNRLSEKTNRDWTAKWLQAPRDFRPDTKMPHFYGLSNNNPQALKGTGQEKFPEAEVEAITHFLFEKSDSYVKQLADSHKADPSTRGKDQERLDALQARAQLTEAEKMELDSVRTRIHLRSTPLLVDLAPGYIGDSDHGRVLFSEKGCLACHNHDGTSKEERGIIRQNYQPVFLPKMASQAQFGPTLTQLPDKFLSTEIQDRIAKAKLGRIGPAKELTEATNNNNKAQGNLDQAKDDLEKAKTELEKAKDTEKGKLKTAVDKAMKNLQETTLLAKKSKEKYDVTLDSYKGSEKPYLDLLGQPEFAKASVWLMQWIMNPQAHSPRSRMPVTHMSPQEVADVAAWLLSQPAADMGEKWNELTVPNDKKLQDDKVYNQLARVYLVRILSEKDIEDLEKGDFPTYRIKDLPQDEQVLVTSKYEINALKTYLGKKAVGRLGCFACHDIPGFENAKPIGVGLNEWGKKDPERLAFEDVASFLRDHYEVVPQLRDEDGKPTKRAEKNKPAYEKFYAEALKHQAREGFLNQKILEPRSYDYNRMLTWDDRARMPQFRFARSKPRIQKVEEGGRVIMETREEYEARDEVEEAEAREAVATFILGLVAEPVPVKSINQPTGDRLAEVKGRQILDKYNCAGCHLVRPGVFDFQANARTNKTLFDTFNNVKGSYQGDYSLYEHHNWAGKNPSPDRLTAHGIQAKVEAEDEDNPTKWFKVQLTQALRFKGPDQQFHDIRSTLLVKVRPEDMIYPPKEVAESEDKLKAFQKEQGPYGGAFADLLANYLMDRFPKDYERNQITRDNGGARASVPPTLMGQGERTQPEWLYQFLLNPQPVRKMTKLRMPRFNMSKDEARALVNYFAAVDRIGNSGIGLVYPYETIPQQEDLSSPTWQIKTAQYVERLRATKVKEDGKDKTLLDKRLEELRPVWKQIKQDIDKQRDHAKAQSEIANARLVEAKKTVADEKDPVKKKELEALLTGPSQVEANWRAEFERLESEATKSSVADLQKAWEQKEAYVTDGYRLLANYQLCLGCHQVGNMLPNQLDKQGPPLALAPARLRPEWSQRWLAHPQRFVTYQSVMPVNFPEGKEQYQQWFVGSSLDQINAVRDVLMIYPRAAAMPVNRYWTLPQPGEKK